MIEYLHSIPDEQLKELEDVTSDDEIPTEEQVIRGSIPDEEELAMS